MEPERLLRCGHIRADGKPPVCTTCLLESDKSRGLGQSPNLRWFDARLSFCFLRLLNPVTRDVQLEDYAVVNKTVDRRGRRHGVFKMPSHLENGRLLEIRTLPRS